MCLGGVCQIWNRFEGYKVLICLMKHMRKFFNGRKKLIIPAHAVSKTLRWQYEISLLLFTIAGVRAHAWLVGKKWLHTKAYQYKFINSDWLFTIEWLNKATTRNMLIYQVEYILLKVLFFNSIPFCPLNRVIISVISLNNTRLLASHDWRYPIKTINIIR